MKLRTRLCIAFCILIFIPLLLTGMAAFGVYRTQSYAFEQAKDVLVDIGFLNIYGSADDCLDLPGNY